MSLIDAEIEDTYFLNKKQPYFFYNELYKNSTEINIALGYFSRTAFCVGTEEILKFIERNGTLRFICNDKLFLDDADAIENGYRLREVKAITIDDFKFLVENHDVNDNFRSFSFKCLSYLIALNRLDIKIVKTDKLVHFKAGYATDNEKNTVAFSGSVNYTLSALLLNYEQLTTYCSWKDISLSKRINELVEPIKQLWNEEIKELPLVTGKEIADYIREKYPVNNIEELENEYKILKENTLKKYLFKNLNNLFVGNINNNSEVFFDFPEDMKPREYQDAAITNWINNNYQSLYAMATGTGKTLTSLFSANVLYLEKQFKSILILVPLKDLVDQWAKDVNKYFHGKVVKINSSEKNWREELKDFRIINLTRNEPDKIVIITTYDSFQSYYKTIYDSIVLSETLVIADEVHNFGSENNQKVLSKDFIYRIGLSATPKRAYDDKGTKAIFDYFCPSNKPYIFNIEDAINNKCLCHYEYYPILVELTEEEMQDYSEISATIRKKSVMEDDSTSPSDELTLLLKKRHRIIERAENKLPVFCNYFEALQKIQKINKAIIFCPEGKNEDSNDIIDEYQSNVWNICKKNHKLLKMQQYVQNTPKSVLKDFENGKLDILFAKKRLNEGIDIPSTEKAFFIASSTSEREFVQRRGRILRKFKDKTKAYIYDFVVVPPSETLFNYDEKDKKSVTDSEMKRVLEFAQTANNFSDIYGIISRYI